MEHTEDLVLAGAQVNPKELSREGGRGQHRGADSVSLGKKGLSPIEDVGRLGFAKAGLVANVERGHDGGPLTLEGGIARRPRPTPQRSRQ
jgi:hypothetical protein